MVDHLLLCCIGYTNINDYNGNYENSYMELLMKVDYRNYCDNHKVDYRNYCDDHDGGNLNDGNYYNVDNNNDGDNNDNDESSDSDNDSY